MHRKGIHCGSTAMGDALRAKGLDLPEEQVFGLGSGAAFRLYDGDGSLTPPQATRFFVGRSLSFEEDLCDTLGADLQSRSYALAGHAGLNELDLVHTDLLELPYLKVRGHWFGHLVVIAGFLDDQVLVWDNELEGTQKVPRKQLLKAMCAPTPGFHASGATVLHVESAPKEVPADAARKAILRNALQMTEQAAPQEGIEGIEQLARELDEWRKAPDWERRARLASQVIETRGCGGGLFRRMYARFLKQSLPALEPLCLKAADAWTAFAEKLETRQIQACADAERALWSRALELCE
jgi:hypothetical protein